MKRMRLMKTEKRAQNRSSGKKKEKKRMSSYRGQRKLVDYNTPASKKVTNFPEDQGGQQEQIMHRLIGQQAFAFGNHGDFIEKYFS